MSATAKHTVVVVGSVNQDLVLTVPAMPKTGETLLATSSLVAAGGKGANQAVAAARAGARTEFIGAFGADAASTELRSTLEGEGVGISHSATSAEPSGRAIVLVDGAGDNCIVVDQGANRDLTAGFVSDRLQEIAPNDVLVVQCELAQETIEAALATGQARGALVILNLAPYRSLTETALKSSTVIVVNEGEAASLAGSEIPLSNPSGVAESIALKYDCSCVVTLGERGSVVAQGTRTDVVPAVQVSKVVDTTGAGDAFVGALAARLAAGEALISAVQTATAVAAHTVMSLGAQAFPTSDELRALSAGLVA